MNQSFIKIYSGNGHHESAQTSEFQNFPKLMKLDINLTSEDEGIFDF